MNRIFDHEKLEVHQESLAFVSWLEPLLQKVPKSLAVRDQLDRASTSVVLNLAEGNGKFTSADRCRFFDISRGSALEAAAGLDVLVAKDNSIWTLQPRERSGCRDRFDDCGADQGKFQLAAA